MIRFAAAFVLAALFVKAAAFAQITVLAFVSAEKHRAIEALNRDLQTKVEKIAEQQRRIMALQSQLTSRAAR